MLSQVFVDAGRSQLLDAQFQPALFGVKLEHLSPGGLSNLENILRVVDPLLGADVAHMDHALDSFANLNEGTEFREAHDRTFDHAPDGDFLRRVSPGVAERLLQPQRHAFFDDVDSENHNFHSIAGLHEVARFANLLHPGHFRDVNQALDAWFQLHECAEIGDASDGAAHALADFVFARNRIPRVRLQLLHADGNAPFFGIDF